MKKLLLSAMSFAFVYGVTAQTVHFSDDFNDGDLAGWTNVDNDSDPTSSGATNYDLWYNGDFSSYFPELGAGTAVSRSWASIGGASTVLNPNNFLISPAINLTSASATGLYLQFSYGTIEGAPYHAEHFAVYVTASADPTQVILATPVHEETLPSDGVFNANIDLSAFAGQTVYLTFRHFNCVDMNTMLIDDVRIVNLAANDVSLKSATLNRYSATSTNNALSMEVKNEGYQAVTSITVDWNDGTAHSSNISVNIAPGATATVSHPTSVNYASVVEKTINIDIAQVNGGADANTANNTGTKKFNTVSAVEKKSVLIEEGTGTWCGWCPRGAVAMEYMYQQTATAKDFIGIAVHNGDPMTVAAYDAAANFGGYPAANADRVLLDQSVSNTAFMNYYNARKTLVPPAAISADITNDGGNNFTIVAKATFRTNFAASNYRLGVIMVEDDVKGTASGYNQTNYYSSASQNIALTGAGHNWQQEPNPVPAANMVYDHVGRALLGGYAGQAGSVPAAITDGQVASYTFNYAKPATSNGFKMKAVVVLIDQANGEVVNAMETPIGFASIAEVENNIAMKLFPNPAVDMLNVEMNGQGAEYVLTLTDLAGKVVYHQNLGNVNGTSSVAIPVSEMQAGNYLLTIATEGRSFTENVVVTK